MFHLIPIIKAIGYLGIFGIIFVETGMLIGFFFPGDTLLFSVGVLAYEKHFNLPIALGVLSLAAIAGGFFGYFIGDKIGPFLFTRKDSLFFKKAYLVQAESFFKKYGNATIFLARFVPIARTFTPTVAGVAHMKYKNFALYNIVSGIVWCSSITLIGYYLGKRVPDIDKYLLPAVAIICLISFLPLLLEFFSKKRQNQSQK